jgi:glutathione peroxidase
VRDSIGYDGDMADTIFDFSINTTGGQPIDFEQFRGRPMLLVNTASKCGFTYQYDGLQKLHEEYGPQGLVVIGFPCDQFHQEFSEDDKIEEFCRINFGVTFPLTTKVDVNGSDEHPIFGFLKSKAKGTLTSAVKWNFTKFLVEPDGVTVQRYKPQDKPESLGQAIEDLLAKSAA